MSKCLFCEIVQGQREEHIVDHHHQVVTFLDHKPLFHGHCLVVPQVHIETLHDLPETLIKPLFAQVQLVADSVKAAMKAQGTFVATNNYISQSVPHLHVHVVPRNRKDGLRGFFWPRQRYDSHKHMAQIAESIKIAIAERR